LLTKQGYLAYVRHLSGNSVPNVLDMPSATSGVGFLPSEI